MTLKLLNQEIHIKETEIIHMKNKINGKLNQLNEEKLQNLISNSEKCFENLSLEVKKLKNLTKSHSSILLKGSLSNDEIGNYENQFYK